MDFRLLGPVEAWSADRPVDLGSRKQRFVFALLSLEVNRLVPVSRLVELSWDDRPPPSARQVIQTLVYRLRAAFADVPGVRLVTAGSGYLLAADPMLIDVHRFRAYTERARASDDAAQRASLLTVALGLWRGPALAGAAPPGIRDRLCGGLEEARLVATEDRVDAELTLGRHDALLEELIGLVRSHPSRERLVAGLMLALYRSGRAAAALELCRMTRLRLADELGLDPGPRLQELERAILRNDPGLDWRAAGPLAP